ncbi:MAG: GNAT family N-acetyltransferase [Phycisphaerae bacterium]|jgi:putative acetyltransferase|nr:GNAT family N-acetyltransferase [Phycisphaerae bacterium]
MDMKIVIRDFRCGDEADVYSLVETVLGEYGLGMDPDSTDRDLADIQAEYVDSGGTFRIVEIDGEIAGSYGLYPVSEKACELRKMYLLSSYQGQGIGRKMMQDLLSWAGESGFTEIVLETNSVLDRAGKLYVRYGFVPYEPEHLSDRCNMAMRLKL